MIDHTNKTFGKLYVVGFAGRINHRPMWRCVCDCGGESYLNSSSLVSGNTKSCGCSQHRRRGLGLPLNTSGKGGPSQSLEYNSWKAAMTRCTKPTHKFYEYYGGRGISMCKEWFEFKTFLKDMGKRPSKKHTIERINNDKGYEPGNCKWATQTEQSQNRSLMKKNTTGVNGVSRPKRRRKYVARIGHAKCNIFLGSFDTIEEATEARRLGELKYWGTSRMAEPLAQQTLSTTMQRK